VGTAERPVEQRRDGRGQVLRAKIAHRFRGFLDGYLPEQRLYLRSDTEQTRFIRLSPLTQAMALSLAPYGVRVNAVGPGSVNTSMLRSVNEDRAAMKKLMSRTPLARIGDPDEIAGAVAFLCSKDASYVTGTCVYADGGRLALNYTVPVAD